MKSLCCLCLVPMLVFAPSIDEKERLNKELDSRIKLNREYHKENLELYEGEEDEKEWIEIETDSSKAMIELIEYSKKSDDNKLKRLILKNEYYMEILFAIDEKSFAESDEEIVAANKVIKKYKQKLLELGDSIN